MRVKTKTAESSDARIIHADFSSCRGHSLYEQGWKSWQDAGFPDMEKAWKYLKGECRRLQGRRHAALPTREQREDDVDQNVEAEMETIPWRNKYLEQVTKETSVVLDGQVGDYKTLVVLSAPQLLTHKFRERKGLILNSAGEAVFHMASVNEIHAWRGVGKTSFSLGLSAALAGGKEFLSWHSADQEQWRVLYLDGELPGEEFQSRVRQSVGNLDLHNFFGITLEAQDDDVDFSIRGPAGRKNIESAIRSHQIDVLFIDSISTLANITTNEEREWLDLLQWFKDLRNKYGIALFYLHHDGKNLSQRGHSKHEDIADKSVHLFWEQGYEGVDGLKCSLKFDKARQPIREDSCLRIELTKDNKWLWTRSSSVERRRRGRPSTENPTITKQIIEMAEQGLSADRMSAKLREEHGKDVPSLSTIKRRLREVVVVEKSDKGSKVHNA